jgi:hypothetical protein
MKKSLFEIEYEKIFRPDTIASLKAKSGESLQQMLKGKDLRQVMRDTTALIPDIIEAEENYIPYLEQLAVDIATDVFPIIKYANIKIDAKIVPQSEVQVNPSKNKPKQSCNLPGCVRAKRRIINGITQGASVRGAFAFLLFKDHLDDINKGLIDKYKEILELSLGIYDNEDAIAMLLAMIAQCKDCAGGSSKAEYDEENEQFIIKARAICFPILLHEIVKGLYEIVGTEGFGADKEKNKDIVNAIDTLDNEPRDLQYGKFIYDALSDLYLDSNIDDPRVRELFFTEVYKLPEEDFIEFIENILNDALTSSQRSWALKTMEEIRDDLKTDDFYDTGLDENKDFDLRKYLSENRLLK